MNLTPPGGIGKDHPDYLVLKKIESYLIDQAGGYKKLCTELPQRLRILIDEVIDTARTKRLTIDEIEKTEKTYIGTKVEIMLRSYLKLQKGKILDLMIDGVEVDIKFTIGQNWTLPPEVRSHPCILVSCNESKALCSLGLFVARPEYLNPGTNRDKKSTISKGGLENVYWLLRNAPYPGNFWEKIDAVSREQIMTPGGGAERLATLFRIIQGSPISRVIVGSIAQQKDYMKRIRRNGGARDILAPEGIAILCGKKDRKLIQKLNLPSCSDDEFISVKPALPEQIQLLRNAKHID